MSAYIQEHDNGLRELITLPGFYISIGDNLYKTMFIPPTKTLDDYTIIEDADYVPPEIPQEEEEITLTQLQENQIKLSKSRLSAYLEDNPLFSTIKYEEGRYYSVTKEKQNLLLQELFKHFLDPKATLYWNSTGESYEEWTFEELKSLKREIENYVRPLVEMQQELEKEIRNSTSNIDILNIELDPYKEVYR